MRTLLLLIVLVLAVWAAPSQNARRPPGPRPFFLGRSRGRAMGPRPKESKEENKAIVQDWFTQKLDHFDSSNSGTWRQQYWHNNQYYQSGSPAFLYIGGEGPESSTMVQFGNGMLWTDLARQNKAWIFDLEHRFYGQSRPTSDMSTPNLQKYLSSRQALEDLADFIKAMNDKYFGGNQNQKWVTFGGSYPGALSAWIRLKHPELVVASSASSAPVLAELDYVEYLEDVRDAITDVSPTCAQSIQQGFQQVATLIQSASGRRTLQSTFNLCDGLTAATGNDVLEFYSAILGWYMVTVQYADIEFSIQNDICSYHTQSSVAVLTRLKNVNDHFNNYYGIDCTYTSYDGYVQFYQDTTYGDAADSRAWIFQTCQEFGYFQSSDSTQDFWSGGLSVDYYTNTCRDVFGSTYTPTAIQANVDSTNAYYGGKNLQSSRIVLPNGSYDPWHPLGIINSTNADIVPAYITGTAHCDDMYSQSSRDSASLKAAKQAVVDHINGWLTV